MAKCDYPGKCLNCLEDFEGAKNQKCCSRSCSQTYRQRMGLLKIVNYGPPKDAIKTTLGLFMPFDMNKKDVSPKLDHVMGFKRNKETNRPYNQGDCRVDGPWKFMGC